MNILTTQNYYNAALSLDRDARIYIDAVESADVARLERRVKEQISLLVKRLKNDGLYDKIKASCLMLGARTLAGALVPLKGPAPTNFNFVSGDYNRITGLKGNKSTKYLTSNRNNNADPQNNQHMSIGVSEVESGSAIYIGAGGGNVGATHIGRLSAEPALNFRNRNETTNPGSSLGNSTGYIGMSRSNSSNFAIRAAGTDSTLTRTSETPYDANIHIYRRDITFFASYTDARIYFYSVGEAIDQTLYDQHTTAYRNAIAAILA